MNTRQELIRLRAEALPWRLLEGEVVAIDLRQSVYPTANASGALLWEALARETTRSELTEILVKAYGLDSDRAGEDGDAFLAEAAARQLLA